VFPTVSPSLLVRNSDALRARSAPDVIDLMYRAPDRPDGSLAAGVPWVSSVRIVLAAAMLARPGPVARGSGVGAGAPGEALVRALAARELVLGIGTLRAYRRRSGLAHWVAAQGLVDAADAALFLWATQRGLLPRPAGYGQAAFALSGAVVEGATWWQLRSN
jgi:hypothetical protein